MVSHRSKLSLLLSLGTTSKASKTEGVYLVTLFFLFVFFVFVFKYTPKQSKGKRTIIWFLSKFSFWYLLQPSRIKTIFPLNVKSQSTSRSVVSNSLQPHGLYSPWNSPGQNTGVGSLSLLQGICLTQGSNPGLPYCRWILYQLSYLPH